MGSVYSGDLVTSRQDVSDYLFQCEVYKKYIIEHVDNVGIAAAHLIERMKDLNLFGDNTEALAAALRDVVVNHDASKWSDEEFEPYRRHFDPTEKEKLIDQNNEEIRNLVEESYEKAWEHHYKNNDHHPEYWRFVVRDDNGNLLPAETPSQVGIEMSILAILHMISDWSGMSLKFRNSLSPISWWNTQAKDERAVMNPKTKAIVKNILEKVYGEEVLDEIIEKKEE